MSAKKMFVNPNFVPKSKLLSLPNMTKTMYVNPHFQPTGIHSTEFNTGKGQVHVNPNFQKSDLPFSSVMQNSHITQPVQDKTAKPSKAIMIKVNKYKSVSLATPTNEQKEKFIQNFKSDVSNLAVTRPLINKKIITYYTKNPHKLKTKHSNIKLVRSKRILNKNVKNNSAHSKKSEKTPYAKGVLKKVNANCPLFAKYGRCAKMDAGSCSYLHNPKAVRSFVKKSIGSSKAKEVCRFYLEGSCNRPECKFAHQGQIEKQKLPSQENHIAFDQSTQATTAVKEEDSKLSRYFTSESMTGTPVALITKREKLGNLPSFIKLS